MKIAMTHAHLVVDGNKEYLDGTLLIEDDKIVEVYNHSNLDKLALDDYKVMNLEGLLVMPGFFDTHTHGAYGIDFGNIQRSDFKYISFMLAKTGVTSFFASLCPDHNILKVLNALNGVEDNYARLQGIHLEGPFINKDYAGILNIKDLKEPDQFLIDEYLLHNRNIKSMTIAYELDNAQEVGKYLRSKNIKVMLGHSAILKRDIKEDYDGITHLYNAMSPFHHRDLSLVNEAFTGDKYVELIADGIHVDKEVLSFTLKNIDRERIVLVTDSSLASGLKDGVYYHFNQKCIKEGKVLKREDGRLAGSDTSINDEMKLLYSLGASYSDLLLYSSLNAYKLYGLDKRYGTITKGKYADLVIMNDDLDVKYTLVKGEVIRA